MHSALCIVQRRRCAKYKVLSMKGADEMRFESLNVYQKSYELALSLYKYCETLPDDEKFGLISQIKRASLSIPLNIAEGYGKQASKTEFNRFLSMAKGSCSEMIVLLCFLKDLGKMEENHHQKYREKYEEIEKMLYGLINSTKS